MAIPPSFSTGIPNQLMSEEEIRQYFMRNGGVVKNTDIVNYFRTYLSNPAIKDEARIIFKTYVNKLASVKVENGEKFLVLKRQYFPPIDGNGNSNSTGLGLPPINAYNLPTQYNQQQQTPSYGQSNYASQQQLGYNNQSAAHNQRLSVSSNSSNFPNLQMNSNSYPSGAGPPPYGYPPAVNPPSASNNNLRRQNSQSQIYGSHFSLNSNYADPYAYSSSAINNNLPSSQQQQYYQQQMSGLGHGHGGSTFSLASQYTTASSAGVPPYHHPQQQQPQQPSLHHQQQQVPMQNTHYHHNVQPQLQRSLSQTQQPYGMQQPVSQMQQYSQHQQQALAKNKNFGGYSATGHAVDYPPEFGLPPANTSVNFGSPQTQHQLSSSSSSSSQHHRHLSPQSSGGSGSTSSLQRAPPPYRPPPSASVGLPTSLGPPPTRSANHSQHHQPMRRSSVSSSSMSGSASNIRYNRSPSNPGSGSVPNFMSGSTQNINMDSYNSGPASAAFQYQRSISVSGAPGGSSLQGLPAVSPPQHSDQQLQQLQNHPGYHQSDGSINLVPGAPPPPVPPRHKRGVERSPSAISGNSNASSVNFRNLQSSTGAGFGGSRHSNRRNMELMNGDSGVVGGMNGGMENDHEKENINQLMNGTNGSLEESSSDSQNDNNVMQNGDSETEQKISVRERMQKFNRIASESELAANKMSSKNKRESKHDSQEFDTASLSSYGYGYGFSHTQLEPRAKEWMLKSAQCDYHVLNKLAQENPSLVRRRDMNYTCLHWAAKKGHVELVKLFAGTYQCDVNAKSNGGYTPLHLAAQFSRQEVYDILVKAYNADVNIRDHSGKKPMQYLVRQDTSVSMDTFKKIKEKRRSTEMQRDRDRDNSFLRIGSLNVKVKSTREAFGYLLGKSAHSSGGMERVHNKSWGSADNIPEVEVNGDKDKDNKDMMMPPPTSLPHQAVRKKKTRRANGGSPTIKENISDSDDSACGFGSDWHSP